MLLRSRLAAFTTALILSASAATAELKLLMFDQSGCVYCLEWDREVGDAYHLTHEGRTAPLMRVDLRAPLPEGVTLARRAAYSPTFILLRDGAEVSRIEGYPGEDFFWGLLAQMITAAEARAGAPKT